MNVVVPVQRNLAALDFRDDLGLLADGEEGGIPLRDFDGHLDDAGVHDLGHRRARHHGHVLAHFDGHAVEHARHRGDDPARSRRMRASSSCALLIASCVAAASMSRLGAAPFVHESLDAVELGLVVLGLRLGHLELGLQESRC